MNNCTEEESILDNEDLVFSNSIQVKIPAYRYSDNQGNDFYVRGDTSFQDVNIDTLNSTPVLAWDSTGMKILSVAIFLSPIIVANSEIVNIEDIVWKWDSGMNFGQDSYVQYSEGKSVINGETADDLSPLPDSRYYWAVWAWNSEGNRILFSSRPLKFYVQN